MNRRPGAWISACAALLAIALAAAPVWDAWRYRRLRSPVGPHVPVGVILPLRSAPPETAPPGGAPALSGEAAPIARTATYASKDAASGAPTGQSPSPTAAATHRTAGTPTVATTPASTVRRADGTPGHRPDQVEPPGRVVTPAQRGRSADPHEASQDRATEPESAAADSGSDPGDHAAMGSIGWAVVPQPDGESPLSPEPQDGPPPPKPVSPSPGPGDPTPIPEAIPTLQLVPFRPALSVGESLVVAVRLSGASNVTSLPFHVEFDPAVLEFQAVEEGPAVGAKQPILLASVSPARPGDLAVGLSLVETGGLLQGSGTVMRLKFRAIGLGSSPLDFSRATIRGRISEPLDARFQNASVQVH